MKSLVALHDGSIDAHSDGTNRGARFTVRLPLTEGPQAPASDPTDAGVAALDIVLIEDNYDSADAPRTLLELWGHRVTLAGDGEQATAGIRLVAITGYGRPEDKRRCLAAGFDSHITKPLSLEVIEMLLGDVSRQRPIDA